MRAAQTLFALLLSALAAGAQVSTSNSYSLLHAELGGAGGATQNADGSVVADLAEGEATSGGTAALTAGGVLNMGGFTGQLYDPRSLSIVASLPAIEETRNVLLRPSATMGDDTTLPVDPWDVTWSVVSGPLWAITLNGLAGSVAVVNDEIAQARGSWMGFEALAEVMVLNVNSDNFGSYAGDGIDDDWQVDFFGINNPSAEPELDPDGDGQSNTFEFLAGGIPTDPTSRFETFLREVPDQPSHLDIVFPVIPERSYTVRAAETLDGENFVTLVGAPATDLDGERSVTDTNAGVARKFYKVEISRP